MEPKLVDKPEMILVGVVGCSSDVSELDIIGLWQRFNGHSEHILHQVEGTGVEVHIQEEAQPLRHFCLIGVEVTKIEDLPSELFIKVIPSGKYAIFTHHFREGSFGEAFKRVYGWLEESDFIPSHPFDIQCYDERFMGPDNPESVLEIHVPVKRKNPAK